MGGCGVVKLCSPVCGGFFFFFFCKGMVVTIATAIIGPQT